MQMHIAAVSSRSSTGATFSSGPAAGSAASRWRTCWPARACWPPTPDAPDPLAPRPAHFPAKAKSVIWLFMEGGPSAVDLFDPKPELDKNARQEDRDRRLQRQPRPADEVAVRVPAVRRVRRLGLREVPERREARRRHRVRQVAATPSRTTTCPRSTRSTPASPGRASRRRAPGSPTAWGARTRTCPGFVVLGNTQGIKGGPLNWGAGFLPTDLPGDAVPLAGQPDPQPQAAPRRGRRGPAGAARPAGQAQRASTWAITRASPTCSARIETFELAYRMQMEATDLVDFSREPAETRRLYGLDGTRVAVVRPEVPDGPPAGRAGRAVRPGLQRRRVGRPQRPRRQPHRPLRRDRRADRTAC